MPLETSVTNIADLNPAWPAPADPKSDGDDHIRNIKKALLNDFAGFTGAVCVTGTDGGSTNAYTVTPATSGPPVYGLRMTVVFSPAVANTGASTISIGGLGVKPLKSVGGLDLVQGDLVPGNIYSAWYNGTEFRLLSPTKNYIDQLAFSSALPGLSDPANNRKYARVLNGSVIYSNPGIATINSTVTTNTTLTAGFLLVPVQMAAMGSSVTLPDATTLILGGPQYIIDNSKGAYSVGIRDNAGTLVMAVAAGGIAMVSLRDGSTVAGAWVVTGTNLEPGLVTLDVTFSSAYGSALYPAFVAMDANTSIHFVAMAAGYAACVVDNAGKVVSGPATVDFTAGEAPKAAFKIDATRIIVFTAAKAVVLTLAGASPSLSISVGTLTAFANNDDGIGSPKLAQLSPTLYVTTNGLVSQALSVSGTTITVGAAATQAADVATTGDYAIYSTSATTALVIYSPNSGAAVKGYVLTVTGVSIAVGTVGVGASGPVGATCLLSPTKAVALVTSSTTAFAVALTVAGTTVTAGTAASFGANTSTSYAQNSATRYNPHLYPLSANSALFWLFNTTGPTSQAVVLSESGGVLTAGATLSASFSSGFVAAGSTSEFLAINNAGSAGSLRFTVAPHKISGSAITFGSAQQVPELLPSTTAGATPAVRLTQGDYLIAAAGITAIPVFRSNGDVAIKRGAIPVPSLGGPNTYPLMAVSSNRLVLMGPVGTQMRLINLEVAA